jgi:hypothetical protein
MLDGRVLTQKIPLSIFATEGPIWNLDLANQGITVTGKKVTIPATVNGEPLLISGSSVLSGDGDGVGDGDIQIPLFVIVYPVPLITIIPGFENAFTTVTWPGMLRVVSV